MTRGAGHRSRTDQSGGQPATVLSVSVGEKQPKGLTCEECGQPFTDMKEGRRGRRFCSPKCRYRNRDRRRYEADPEGERAKSRAYYAANRERVIARVIARQAAERAKRNGRP
jgi:ssDNA-binding Zn-finger/Zn-ribbon topoisomerase 1